MGTTRRRTFLKIAGIGGASILADMTTSGEAQAQEPPRASIKAVETPVLSIAYEDSGDPRGFPVILLHGFPDDARAYDEVVPPLTKAGYRAMVPYIRGYGATRFRDAAAPRMAEQAAIGQDVNDFADGRKLPRFPGAGHDGGRRPQPTARPLPPRTA